MFRNGARPVIGLRTCVHECVPRLDALVFVEEGIMLRSVGTRGELRRAQQAEASGAEEAPSLDRPVRPWKFQKVRVHDVHVNKWVQGSMEEVEGVAARQAAVRAWTADSTKGHDEAVIKPKQDEEVMNNAQSTDENQDHEGTAHLKIDGENPQSNTASDAMELQTPDAAPHGGDVDAHLDSKDVADKEKKAGTPSNDQIEA